MSLIRQELENLATRWLPEGGFSGQPGGVYRPDATAWGVLSWQSAGLFPEKVSLALDRLAAGQARDGRVPLEMDCPEAAWPTADAILAWQFSDKHRAARDRAVDFLLHSSGKVVRNDKKGAVGHDTSLRGWPWIQNTHSWVEPTSMGLLALESAGKSAHARAEEAYRLLLNRQLEKGGWNYGNTTTYSMESFPSMESTGLALHALFGHTEEKRVESSLGYLISGVPQSRTPLWLGWTLLALSAWGKRPNEASSWIEESLERQKDYGSYDTAWLGVLLTAAFCDKGLVLRNNRVEAAS